MKLSYFHPTWGLTGPIEEQLARITAAGFEGVEHYVSVDTALREGFRKALGQTKLRFIAQILCPDNATLEHWAPIAADLGAEKIVMHGGRDSMDFDTGCRFCEAALRVQEKIGITICHETHRGRIFFTSWNTAPYLRKFPELRICADFSHWVCVAERLLDDRADDLTIAIQQTAHVHARVGYEEGPQITDPRAPEWKVELETFLGWWQRMIQARSFEGAHELTIDPEFGPPNYLHTLPFSHVPVADLWDLRLAMREILRNRLVVPL